MNYKSTLSPTSVELMEHAPSDDAYLELYNEKLSEAHQELKDFSFSPSEIDEYFFETAYANLTEGHAVTNSIKEPLNYQSLRSALWTWAPERYISQFISGTLTCPPKGPSSPPEILAEPDERFFLFVSNVYYELRRTGFNVSSLGIAAVRTREPNDFQEYRFLLEIPLGCSVEGMKLECLNAGPVAWTNGIYPMLLLACESAAEWMDILIDQRRPEEHIESFVKWHWRLPVPGLKRRRRKGWARRRALAAIKRARAWSA